jgi:lysine-specific demethylase 8
MGDRLPPANPRRIPAISLERWVEVAEQARREATPYVIPHGLDGKCSQACTPELLASEYPNVKVPVTVNLPSGVPYAVPGQPHERTMRVADFLQLLVNGAASYMNQVPLKLFPALARDIDLGRLRLSPIRAVNLWVGAATRSGLHFDSADNMFGQIYGSKRVLLVAPQFARCVYAFADVPSKSQVDPENPDLQKFPRFAECPRLEYQLEPGDLLYIPRGWWHFLAADNISISVNCWHGKSLRRLDRWKSFVGGGPRIWRRWVRDFVWHGLLGHPFEARLFSPPPLGVRGYRRVRKLFGGK